MKQDINILEPTLLWSNFNKLTQIPRPSKKETRVINEIAAWAGKNGLEFEKDATENIVVRKKASPGFENRKTIILQAHIDMVPQANSNIAFNFETDPISAYIDGDWVTAKDTTLGADNGIGVAAAMAILESDNIQHGPIEMLITVDEETGMTGANNLQKGFLKGDILINLDTECEDEISIGCAGGVDVNAAWKFFEEENKTSLPAFQITIKGLKGGHSGLDINLGRGNACKLMGRILKTAVVNFNIRLSSIDCGNMRNAIPREGAAIFVVPDENKKSLQEYIHQIEKTLINELGKAEPGISVNISEVEKPDYLIPEMIQDDLINAICAATNGVIRMSDTMPGVVETSTNLSIVKSSDGQIDVKCLTRSFIDTARDGIASSLESCFRLAGAAVEITGAYPGWKPNPSSEILQVARECFQITRGITAREVAMHAGLECGILGAKYPNWDMVSIGPTIESPHSPDERVHINSVMNFWKVLLKILESAPKN
jgi:dipeptidase D